MLKRIDITEMRFPVLRALMDKELVWIEDHNFVGEAYDGCIVQLGNAFSFEDADRVEAYLLDNPFPSTW